MKKLQKAIEGLIGEGELETQLTKQLMCIRDELCFIWSSKDNCILAVIMDDSEESCCTKLVPTDPPIFDVEKVAISQTGRWLCLWGSRGATAVEIPRRSGKTRKFIGTQTDGSIVVHSVAIGERFFLSNLKIVLQQVCTYDLAVIVVNRLITLIRLCGTLAQRLMVI